MNIKDAVNFLRKRSPEKDEILKLLFGEDKYERFNFLPVSRFVLPVNKANAVKSGIISAKDLPNTVDQITVSYRSSASRAAEALTLEGKKAKAIEVLDLASREIPSTKYNDPFRHLLFLLLS